MTLAPGTRVGIYEILGPIGAGGMGEVYRARDTKLKRDVAMKVLPDSFAQDADRMARFQREAEVLASLNHPNIAAIYGVEERALVMELVEGENLKGPLPIETAINYASQIALGLEAAHDKGIVHRDLKPANIKVTPSGVVKVLDFGLAAVAQASTADTNPANSPTLTLRATEAGFILGTAAYMAPEQAAGKPVDHRADIWSFGVVLWEMLTGKHLFEGETVSHTLAAVLTKDPDWTFLPASTPKNVRRLLRRCLDRDVKRRLRDIGDAWIELNTVEEPVSTQVEVAKRPGFSRWIPWIAAAVLALAVVSFVVLRRPAQPGPVVRWAYTQDNPFGMPAISHDGSRMVYSEYASGNIHLVLRSLNQVGSRVIAGTETSGVPVFSPDDQSIAYAAGFTGGSVGSRLQRLDLNGGAPGVVCECTVGIGLSWGDDGNIVYSDGKKLLRVASTSGAPQPLIAPDAGKGQLAYLSPFVLPGARAVLFAIETASNPQVALLDLKDGKYRVLLNGQNPEYISAGWLTYYRSGTLYGVPFNLKGLAITGSEKPLLENLASVQNIEAGDYSVSRDGILVYMSGRNEGGKTVLAWVDRNGVVQSISEPQQWGNGRLSPDGRFVANSISGSGKTDDIWLLDTERRTPVRLTFAGQNHNPVWTPDGRRIAYFSSGAGKAGLYWIASDGSGKPELLLETNETAVPSSFTPDGKTLIYSEIDGKVQHMWMLGVGAGAAERKPVQLHDTPFSEGGGQVSPDGKYIAYASIESGASDIYVQPFPGPGPKVRISTQGGATPRWLANGRELFYWTRGRDSMMAVDVRPGATFEASVPHLVLKVYAGTTWDIAPDGKKFLIETLQNGNSLQLVTVVNWFNELPRAK